MTEVVRIGSRGSRLALVQAEWVRDRVAERHPGLAVEIEIITTKGDKILDAPLAKIGDKGLFTKELENALLDRRIDVAVHSAKDMPTAIPDGLAIIAFTEREDVRDAFVPNPSSLGHRAPGAGALTLADVPEGARVGSSSLRRRSQLLALRPDLDVVDIRGNVETRLRKLVDEGMAGTILAAAGLNRLGRSDIAGFAFAFGQMLPAVGQGALAIEARVDHPRLGDLTAVLDHRPTALAVRAERALLGTLEGGCQVPIAAHAEWEAGTGDGGTLALAAYVGSLDGERSVRGARTGLAAHPEELGRSLAADLLERGADDILAEIRTP
ncbi:MAG TPA: hydroxymethylbilane synthase [Thermoleophilia bacterium]|nr:hydroxymethylbilane synthase [Thermoleophilia bacterium]